AHKPMPTVALSFSSHSSAMRRYLASSGESVFHILLTNLYGITRLEEGSPPGSAQRPKASAASDHTRRAPIARHGDLCCGQHPALCPQKPPRLRLRREPTAGSPSPTAAPGLRGRRASTRSGIRLLQSLGLERLPRGVLKSGPLRARLLLGQSVFSRLVGGHAFPGSHRHDHHGWFSPDRCLSVNDPVSTFCAHIIIVRPAPLLVVHDLGVILRVIDMKLAAPRFSKDFGIMDLHRNTSGLSLRQVFELVDQLLLDRSGEVGDVVLLDSAVEANFVAARHEYSSIRFSCRCRTP